MKPYITKETEFICSSCVSRFEEEYLNREMNYCPRCGVKIDWDFGTVKYIIIKLKEWVKLLDRDGENTKDMVRLEMIKLLEELESD